MAMRSHTSFLRSASYSKLPPGMKISQQNIIYKMTPLKGISYSKSRTIRQVVSSSTGYQLPTNE
jgi:hypothetical protein